MAEDQTRMAFMSDADEKVDPVSGNDVPPGSLPVEVRDDIDAKLSEGEYVVPADVVRFFGVKLFEDLRMEAKRGLAAMDEDGRIGGEPVPEEVYNDDEVVTDEDLEKLKGMLTTGMADGGLIDKIVNAAKTDPTVNKVLNAQGVTVGMAEGGVVKRYANGGYEEGKVEEALKGVMGLVRTNPELQQMLASKGLKINTTGADKTAEAMENANKPNKTTEPIMEDKRVTVGMAEGGMVAGDPFDFEEKARASAAEGDNVTPAQMKQVLADFDALPQFKGVYNEDIKYLANEGSLVSSPNSTFNFQDWMTLGYTPATDMFSFLANNTEGLKMIKYVNADGRILELAEGVAPPAGFELYTPPAATAPTAQAPIKERRTGDDSGPDPEPDTEPTPPPNFSKMTTDELKAAMDSANMVNKFSNLGMLLGPVGALGGIAIQATMRSRGIQIGKAAEEKLKSTDKSSAEYAKLVELVKRGGIASSGPTGWIAGKLAKKADENATAAAKKGEVDPTPTITAKVFGNEKIVNVDEKIPGLTAKQQSDADARKAEKDRKAAEAAEKARQAQAAQARASYAAQVRSRKSSNDNDNGGGGSTGGGSTGGGGTGGVGAGTTGAGTDGSSSSGGGKKSGGGIKSGPTKGNLSSERSKNEAAGGYSGGGKYGGFNKGGLLNKPKTKSYANGGYVTANEPAKKKKKRKGLGTRP